MRLNIPRYEFPLHPEEPGEGICLDWFDEGENETQFGLKKQVSLRIRSTTHFYEDQNGNKVPFILYRRANLSSGPKAHLPEWRERILGRKLTGEELQEMGLSEADGVRVRYEVVHYHSDSTDRIYDRIEFARRIPDSEVEDVADEKQLFIDGI